MQRELERDTEAVPECQEVVEIDIPVAIEVEIVQIAGRTFLAPECPAECEEVGEIDRLIRDGVPEIPMEIKNKIVAASAVVVTVEQVAGILRTVNVAGTSRASSRVSLGRARRGERINELA